MGKGIVDKLKEEYADRFTIEDEWLPYEIHPETPAEGVLLKDYFLGMDIEAFQKDIDRRGKTLGTRFNHQPLMSNSRKAMMAGEYAKEQGKDHEFHEAMFKAYFTDAKDIGDMEVICAVAEEVGLDTHAMETAIEDKRYLPILENTTREARNNFVTAAPTFIIEGGGTITGAQPIDTFREAFEKGAAKL